MSINIENLRILWLDDGQCILFNSQLKRVSKIYPAKVGKMVEALCKGMDFDVAAKEMGVLPQDCETAKYLIYHIGGGVKVAAPIPLNRPCFYRTLVLAPSAMCNLRCVYCSGDAGERSNDKMDWSMAKAAIDYFFANCFDTGPYTLQFHGAGEPMTAPDIVKKSVEYARQIAMQKKQPLFTRISTNGIMTEEQAIWLAQNMNHISLSIDGLPEVHNVQRPLKNGGNSYDTVIRSLSIFRRTGALKRINMVVTNNGLEHMEEHLRHIYSLCGSVALRILPMEFCGRCEKTNQIPVDRRYFNQKLPDIIKIANELGIQVLTAAEQMDYCTEHYCQACGYAMCVTPSGDVSTCVEAMSKDEKGIDEFFIGTYDRKSQTFLIDWNKVATLRKRNYASLESCQDCAFRTNCAGNCPMRAARKHGTIFSISEEACEMTKKVLTEELLKLATTKKQIACSGTEMKPSTKDINAVAMPHTKNGTINAVAVPHCQNETISLSLLEMQQLSRKVFAGFAPLESRTWGIEAAGLELMKQVGDLTKLLMGMEHYYLPSRIAEPAYSPSKERIGDELADILHWIFYIADYYGISLENAFLQARQAELTYIQHSNHNKNKVKIK